MASTDQNPQHPSVLGLGFWGWGVWVWVLGVGCGAWGLGFRLRVSWLPTDAPPRLDVSFEVVLLPGVGVRVYGLWFRV